ncbi:PH domain-containing protein [Virgibacillus alimentarius]|uniref:Membrane protein n=1 Tax=Virgibacillus alimentarius TaxID=698769 RepID=A0ABS4SBM9_9BACI|nr:PH domain-containing protein [Virgibacillus alimentarius]MBP2258304.1 putative membrane protein [Virgibacillus alimentarius]HLR67318.1 PH domain-containing protein [Virgibacillus sp.]
MSSQRLHPITIVFTAIKTIKDAIIPIIAMFFASFQRIASTYIYLGVAIFLILLITFSILSWYRFSYRVENEELRIEYGIFIRNKRYISKNRIQSIDLTAGVVHRLFRLVQVQIETAGGGTDAEASLKAVKRVDGERLREALKITEIQVPVQAGESINPSRHVMLKNLFIAGSTSGSVGVILALFAFSFAKIEQFIPDRIFESTIEWLIGLSILFLFGLSLVILLFLWLLGIAGTIIKYGNFTIKKNNDELFITRGLLEKKQITIPLKRIQAVGIEENLIRQPLGYVSIFAEIAGGSMEKGEDFSTILFPIMKASEVDEFLQQFLPAYRAESNKVAPLPKRAAKFYLLRVSSLFIFGVIGMAYFLPSFVWVAVVLLALSLLLGFLRYRDGGYRLEGKCLTIRYRGISRRTVSMYQKRIQSLEKKQHKIQKIQKLATMKLSIIGTGGSGRHYALEHMDNEQANRLAGWYSFRNEKPKDKK